MDDFVRNMMAMGYSREMAEDTIWIASDTSDLTGREFNFASIGDGRYAVLKPSDRSGHFPALTASGDEVVGTLDQAFEYVLDYFRREAPRK